LIPKLLVPPLDYFMEIIDKDYQRINLMKEYHSLEKEKFEKIV